MAMCWVPAGPPGPQMPRRAGRGGRHFRIRSKSGKHVGYTRLGHGQGRRSREAGGRRFDSPLTTQLAAHGRLMRAEAPLRAHASEMRSRASEMRFR